MKNLNNKNYIKITEPITSLDLDIQIIRAIKMHYGTKIKTISDMIKFGENLKNTIYNRK